MNMKKGDWKYLGWGAALLAFAALLPLTGDGYLISLGVSIAMYVVLATSWALFSGPTHYISLATAAFFGVGTYVMGSGIEYISYWALLPIAGLIGGLIAALVGLATLRLSGVYFVIFTLGLAEMTRQAVTWYQNQTGHKGTYVLTDLTDPHIYWQLLVLAGLVFLLGWAIGRSKLGFALRIIGDDEDVARHVGINTALSKVALFVVSGATAAIVGAMIAPRYIYIEPATAFTPMLSFQVVIMALLGGTGRLWGPLVGVIPFTLLWEAISSSFPNQTTLLLGLSFLAIVYLLPGGFVGLYDRLKGRAARRSAMA